MTLNDIKEAMGPETTDAEARAMSDLLGERGIEFLDDISDEKFFDLIPEAMRRANTCNVHYGGLLLSGCCPDHHGTAVSDCRCPMALALAVTISPADCRLCQLGDHKSEQAAHAAWDSLNPTLEECRCHTLHLRARLAQAGIRI